ncbi:hypothetical protein, partial [Tabrizicola sp.]|uniref:hypothetical protein n=1 Tax=Tabrizicola sp. TaxID=2005166 RepID=UPI0027356738
MVERQNDASTFNEMPDWAGLTIDVIVEGQLIATEVSLARAGVTMMGSAATRVIPGVGLALEVGFGVIDVVGAVRNGTERDVVIQSAGLAGTVTGGTVATLLGTTVLTGSALVASSPLLAGAILAGAVVGTAYGVGKLFELAAASYYDRPIETDRLRAEKEAADSDSGHLKNAILMGIYNDPSIPKSPEVKRAEEALAKANKAKITNEKVSNGNEPIMDEDLFGIPGPGPAYGYNSNGYGASSTSKGSGSPTSGSASTKTKQESYADKYSGSGGGGGDSGKAGSAVSSKSTSSSKNEYGYEKTTTTTTYKSGV